MACSGHRGATVQPAGHPGASMAIVDWQPIPTIYAGTGYRPSALRARWALLLVGIATAALGVLAVVVALGVPLLDHVQETSFTAQALAHDQLVATLGQLRAVTYIASAIAFLAWLSRAVDNTPALGGGMPEFSPRAAIGWWFAPFANLIRGHQIVADLWRRMALTDADEGTRTIHVWWVAWIGGNAVTTILAQTAPHGVDAVRSQLMELAVVYAVSALSGILLLWIMWVIERRVEQRVTALFARPAAGAWMAPQVVERMTFPVGPASSALPETAESVPPEDTAVPGPPGAAYAAMHDEHFGGMYDETDRATPATYATCPGCDAPLDDDDPFCPGCGRRVDRAAV